MKGSNYDGEDTSGGFWIPNGYRARQPACWLKFGGCPQNEVQADAARNRDGGGPRSAGPGLYEKIADFIGWNGGKAERSALPSLGGSRVAYAAGLETN
jgi:hypothetical protein